MKILKNLKDESVMNPIMSLFNSTVLTQQKSKAFWIMTLIIEILCMSRLQGPSKGTPVQKKHSESIWYQIQNAVYLLNLRPL